MYTSGWPKNQNKCWYKRALPPPLASKKEVFRFRSKSSIVIPLANTGRERISRNVVITSVHRKSTNASNLNDPFPLRIEVIKLKEATKLETPMICNLKIVTSTEAP